MPAGVPVGCVAIGKPGAINSALFASSILALTDDVIAENLKKFRLEQTNQVIKESDLRN